MNSTTLVFPKAYPIEALNLRMMRMAIIAFMVLCNGCATQQNRTTTPALSIGRSDASSYLSARHRELLLKRAARSASDARALVGYYRFCIGDEDRARLWEAKAKALDGLSVNRDVGEGDPVALSPDQLLKLQQRALHHDASAARRIAESYWHVNHDDARALVWMEKAEQLGDIEASSYMVRLKVTLGLAEFVRPQE